MTKIPDDKFADLTQLPSFAPLDNDLVDHAEFSNPAYIVEMMEVENIELFGVNLNGNAVKPN